METIESALEFRRSELARLKALSFKDFREVKREWAIIRIEREIKLLESLL